MTPEPSPRNTNMLDTQRSVADLVLAHSACAPVFQRHKIDFCCRGHLSLEEAARGRALDVGALVQELTKAIDERGPRDPDPATFPTPRLIEHLVTTHHAYLREALPFVLQVGDKVARVHGEHNPKLVTLAREIHAIAEALLPHLDFEEQVLFPRLLQVSPDASFIAAELDAMTTEHRAVGELLASIREACDDFTLPPWACNSYRALFAELAHLETDVLTHVHLENHALMPRFAKPGVVA